MQRLSLWVGAIGIITSTALWAEDIEGVQSPDKVELDASTQKALSRSNAEFVVLPDGRKQLVLNGGHRHVFVARIGEDGRVETVCVDHEEDARRFLAREDLQKETP